VADMENIITRMGEKRWHPFCNAVKVFSVRGSGKQNLTNTSQSNHKFMACVVPINLSKSACIRASGMDNTWALFFWWEVLLIETLCFYK